jgi:hypothetical protein
VGRLRADAGAAASVAVLQTRRYPSLASHERPGDSLRRDEKAAISDRARRDGQRFASRVQHACLGIR